MAKSVKARRFVHHKQCPASTALLANITGISRARGNRKVVELVTLEGNVFSTLPRGVRAKVSA